ncbi:MAG: hypothetical protein U1E61_12980 [Bradyrhizobium sp.]
MALIVICVTGPPNTGKSDTIRTFTADHLKYEKAKGDVLGVFPMSQRNYAVGVNGYGDNRKVVKDGLEFLDCYDGLMAVVVVSRSHGETFQEVERFAERKGATVRRIFTKAINGGRAQKAAIRANVREVMRLMPGRQR